MKQDNSVEIMWEAYLKTMENKLDAAKLNYTAWYFCNNEKDANDLALLVNEGVKRGTASLYYWYEKEGEELPAEGNHSIITDWDGVARCVIRTVKVTVLPFKDVSEELAAIEGEGDKSLRYWRETHAAVFTKELHDLGKEFTDDVKVVFEEFEVVYQ